MKVHYFYNPCNPRAKDELWTLTYFYENVTCKRCLAKFATEQEEERNEPEMVQVTHDMAVDAGDRSLEGQWVEW